MSKIIRCVFISKASCCCSSSTSFGFHSFLIIIFLFKQVSLKILNKYENEFKCACKVFFIFSVFIILFLQWPIDGVYHKEKHFFKDVLDENKIQLKCNHRFHFLKCSLHIYAIWVKRRMYISNKTRCFFFQENLIFREHYIMYIQQNGCCIELVRFFNFSSRRAANEKRSAVHFLETDRLNIQFLLPLFQKTLTTVPCMLWERIHYKISKIWTSFIMTRTFLWQTGLDFHRAAL